MTRATRPAAASHRPSSRHPGSRRRRAGAVDVVRGIPGKLFADAAYQGPQFARAVAKRLPKLAVEIVKRSDKAKGFEVLPMRWVVERTLAWLNRCRRLAKDFENLTDNALAFLRLASIRFMLRRLCNPSKTFRTDSQLAMEQLKFLGAVGHQQRTHVVVDRWPTYVRGPWT
jgi:transposase